jgi:hypothetical protein
LQRGFIFGDRRLGAFALLQVIAQRGLFIARVAWA